MKKTLLALASIALVSSVAVSAQASDANLDFKVRSVQAVVGQQKIDVVKIKKADDVLLTQQVVQTNIDVESEQKIKSLNVDVASLGLVAGQQDVDKVVLRDVKKVDIGQTIVGTSISAKLTK